MKIIKKLATLSLIFFATIVLDRITKWFVLTHLAQKTLSPISGLNISLAWNRGISWGMFNNSSEAGFIILAILIAAIIILFLHYTITEFRRGTSIFFEVLVLAGALSNFFDRIWYGAVIDFIDCYVGAWHWATFNVADAAIVIGIFGIMGRMIIWNKKN